MLSGTLPSQTYAKHEGYDLTIAIAAVRGYRENLLAPSKYVLDHAKWVVRETRTASSPASILYVLREYNFGFFHICAGWMVIEHPLLGGPPATGYTIALCSSKQFQPVASPSPSPTPPALR